ncbi:histidine kinase [Flammeovirgaceae bacterium SG7u.111]|nr:histidine kinase [Flammeovirgaceae bacterium SG7u.132]WPO35344.1 histidine kinase [Flammeovirgaceae bacterium SG7u.111]
MSIKSFSIFEGNKRLLYWFCQFSGWSLMGLYTLIVNIQGDGLPETYIVLDTMFTLGCLMMLSHLYRYFIIKWGWLKIIFSKLILRIMLSSFILAIVSTPFSLLSTLLFHKDQLEVALTLESLIVSVITVTFLYFGWSLAYVLYHYVTNYNRNLKWEALINEFELNQLKSQLNPHFIFNALNTVKALVDEDPQKAKDSINQLSNILRNSLMMDKKKVIPFQEELNIVRDYLNLENTRYEERLSVAYDIDDLTLGHKVPPMMIQTIVENGIKHGIAKLKNGGQITIKTSLGEDRSAIFEIRNTGTYDPKPERREGYGLKSTKQRLALLYHNRADFSINNEKDQSVLTYIKIPQWDNSELVTSTAPQ